MTKSIWSGRNSNRFQSLAMIAIFDVAGPLVAYSLLRSAGLSAVSALVLRARYPPQCSGCCASVPCGHGGR